jgi:TPR repeat protein
MGRAALRGPLGYRCAARRPVDCTMPLAHRALPHRTRLSAVWRAGVVGALLAASVAAPAQPLPRALPAALQGELDAAVGAHAAGRIDEARAAFEGLARREVPAALYNLGLMHLRGELRTPAPGAARSEATDADRAEAERLLLRAAGGGFVTAMLLLAECYETGRFGPARRDLALAHDWYEQAALSGSVNAQVAMGTAHYLGRGRPKDGALALQWYRQAANGGDIGAMYLVASIYEHGDGVPADLRLARHWYEQAALGGDEAAPGKLKEVQGKLAGERGI